MAARRQSCGEALLRSYRAGTDTDTSPVLTTRSLAGPQIEALRVRAGRRQLGLTDLLPVEDTYIVGISTTGVSDHEVLGKGNSPTKGGFAADSMRIYDLADELRIDVVEPYEIVDFLVPRAALNDFAFGVGYRRVGNLSCPFGIVDPVMVHLTRALLPYFDRPQEANALLIDSVQIAVTARLLECYGSNYVSFNERRVRASLAQVLRAQEMLAGHLEGKLLIADIARECGLSWQHLIKLFRQETGLTPHQWLLQRRVDQAMDMLKTTNLSIAEIALRCGFADQRHLNRVFYALTGTSPALWREQN
ncbi:MAG: AraC family transcriptional regulator [Acidobacteriaceae bacterium]|nr:AraC family transcriptional regulator [Acidobacteriaceae bacterium]